MFDQTTYQHDRRGQGLVEYALILVLVAVVAIAILTLLGPTISSIFCNLILDMGGDSCGDDVAITSATYNSGVLKLDATYKGGADEAVSMVASPGGTMIKTGNKYSLTKNIDLDCPCRIVVISSKGGGAAVTVGE